MRLFCLSAIAATVLGLAAPFPADAEETPKNYAVYSGLTYSQASPHLKLDLVLPREASRPAPCVVLIQGGAFKTQNGQWFRPFALYLAENGFVAALIAYRGRPDHTYRETMADVTTAVRFLRKVSGEYGIDPNRIGVMGRSAGATLAALLAVGADIEEFQGDGEHGQFSSRVQAGVVVGGVYDFVARFTDEEQVSALAQLEKTREGHSEWIGATFAPTDRDWLRASAINHLDPLDPPLLLMHSKDDPAVSWLQSQEMHQAMLEGGVASELEIAEDGGHRGPPTLKESMLKFFRKFLLGK